ncbi:MAG: imidazole glycerol phosphate synthase subunit HisH [Methanoregulaceae archaeon]|nr:imidazole glycerol phosphate synthase subunit HisH [Methanoregulaceae archaeon]
MKIVIVDYGLGNLRSVMRGLEKAGASAVLTSEPEVIDAADGVVLPGVGAFREGMEQLGELRSTVMRAAGDVPVLGICLGMQMLLEVSEEHGLHQGLSLVPGVVRQLPRTPGMKIPHMGWNTITVRQPGHPLFEGFSRETYMYFVHSFYAESTDECVLSTTDYSCRFASTVASGNAFGVQFHPEKSGEAGLRLLANFIGLC